MISWKPYVPVAERRRKAAAAADKSAGKGKTLAPVRISGRKIATTFWGEAWCENLERYSDFANRLPRGRSYARNGSVIDLQIAAGEVIAKVHGSRLYAVHVKVKALPRNQWAELRRDCAGAIDSLVGLLQGRFSDAVMERLCKPKTGMFPTPAELSFSCSCPDWALMCKHVAASLYGIGARLDSQPELLFLLRQVDHADLIDLGGGGPDLAGTGPAAGRMLESHDLGALFGLELDAAEPVADKPGAGARKPGRKPTAKRAAKSPAKRIAAPPAKRTAKPPAKRAAAPSAKRAAKQPAKRAAAPSAKPTAAIKPTSKPATAPRKPPAAATKSPARAAKAASTRKRPQPVSPQPREVAKSPRR